MKKEQPQTDKCKPQTTECQTNTPKMQSNSNNIAYDTNEKGYKMHSNPNNIAYHANDKGYKKIFSIKKNFLDFIQKYVALEWMKDLTVNDLELIDKEFITDQFETYESDLVYKVTKDGQEVYLFFLFELQSKNDFSMPFRILVYMTAIWLDYFKNSDRKERVTKNYRLPMILPIVLHNGPTSWKAGRHLRELIKNGELFGEYAVNFKYVLVSVKELSKEKIVDSNTLVDNILFSDKIRSKEELPSYLTEINQRVRQLETEDQNAWMNWFLHAFRYGNREEKKQFVELFQRGDDTMCSAIERIMNETWAEVRQEGVAEGMERGMEQEKKQTAKRMLENKLEIMLIMNITGLSREQIDEVEEEMKKE